MIRTAQPRDLARILEIYDYARGFMEKTGNASQWGKHFPPEELLREDIRAQRLFAIEEGGEVHGVFAFLIGDDPTYQTIEQGSWLACSAYGTIHRIAGDGQVHGLLRQAVDFGWERIPHLRIDTHEDNRVMQHLIEKCGFAYCGVIHVDDGSPRLAYERV